MPGKWLKAELHAHCNLDPVDHPVSRYSAEDLIRRAADLRFDVLAITCHDIDVWTPRLAGLAADHGILLIPGMEVTCQGRHVLAYNFRAGSGELDTLSKIRSRRRDDTLVIAPHPWFPAGSCLRGLLEPNIDLFDAVELSGFYLHGVDFNRRARQIAGSHGKPLVGNGDVHRIWQLGPTFTWIDADRDVLSVLDAVRAGRVRIETRPLTYSEVAAWFAASALGVLRVFRNPRPEVGENPVLKAEGR
jgi:predicted metal-dependent phosphoesterase TrpH